MSIFKNRAFLVSFISIFICFIVSLILNFSSVKKNETIARDTNKIFTINTSFNKERGQFLLSTENNMEFIKSISKFVHNVSYVIFDIDEANSSKVARLFDFPDNVSLGFSKFNEDILQKARYFGHQFLLKLHFYNENYNGGNELWVNVNADFDETRKRIDEDKKFLALHKSSIYIEDTDVEKMEGDQFLIDKLLELNPFITTKKDTCNEKTRICFLSMKNDDLLMKVQEIFSNYIKNNDKWFIAIEYDSNSLDKIEEAIRVHDNKFLLNINKSLLDSLLRRS